MGALPQFPGKSYRGMYRLLDDNAVSAFAGTMFTTELLVAICWEETFFNNVPQVPPGTAVGFGQTEPSEFWKYENKKARDNGYFVEGLPRRDKTGHKLLGTLTDIQSVQVMSAMLSQLFLDLKQSPQAALEGYAGVPWSRSLAAKVKDGTMTQAEVNKVDPLGVDGRRGKINGWRVCERILVNELPTSNQREKIKDALSASKPFNRKDQMWETILFPSGDDVP